MFKVWRHHACLNQMLDVQFKAVGTRKCVKVVSGGLKLLYPNILDYVKEE